MGWMWITPRKRWWEMVSSKPKTTETMSLYSFVEKQYKAKGRGHPERI